MIPDRSSSRPTTWFTADLHLGHANIIRYCQRPFFNEEETQKAQEDPRGKWRVSAETVARHDDFLLQQINTLVHNDDVLWILGDFCWGDFSAAQSYRERIACQTVNLVWGNHDHRSIAPLFQKTMEQGMVRIERQEIWLNHYPMRSWHKRFHGSFHLYGHVHGRFSQEDAACPWMLTKDMGVDACSFQPVSFQQIQEEMAQRIPAFLERKAQGIE